ncbi:Y 2 isoform X1 [Octopus vulgaris]|uniref:Y 2 isoform X1 n=1 Tax=Octopus vulgaris TaxID=6645 RepID=A0AA36AKT9_OCTVU|nr:Y 2 isoform X1 [Octopus vulgaris]
MMSNSVKQVKQIIGRRTRRISGKYHLEYLIRWKGFGHKGDTWEPVSNLKSCQVLVRKYERQHGKISLRNTSACKILKNAIKSKKTPNSKKVSPDSKSRTSVNVKRENGVSDECTECDSDDDLLYSLVSKPTKPKKKIEPKTVKKVPKATSKNCETIASCSKVPLTVLASKTTTPCTTKKKGMKRMKLLDSVKKNESKAVISGITNKPVSAVTAYTADVSQIKRTSSMNPATMSMDTLYGDVPGFQMLPMIPTSPSTNTYRLLMSKVPPQPHLNKKHKRKEETDSSDEECQTQIERRLSVRQSECAFRYKEIVVKKSKGYTQIWLNTHTELRNALNPQVIQEVVSALNSAKYDDSHLVMFSSLGSVFCSGIDLHFLLTGERKVQARKMADALREFTKAFITFPKPIVAVVPGAAIGTGMAILPICDITYASDKATFYLPYSQLGQTPEACASYTLPLAVGIAMANELLLGRRKVTATEAHQLGLISQVFWPTSLMQEVIPRIQTMANSSAKAMEATKLLVRSHQRTKLELTNETECNYLFERWSQPDYQKAIHEYLSDEKNFSY